MRNHVETPSVISAKVGRRRNGKKASAAMLFASDLPTPDGPNHHCRRTLKDTAPSHFVAEPPQDSAMVPVWRRSPPNPPGSEASQVVQADKLNSVIHRKFGASEIPPRLDFILNDTHLWCLKAVQDAAQGHADPPA
jgi:hypothetical protein